MRQCKAFLMGITLVLPVNLSVKIPNIKGSQNVKEILIVSDGNVKACSKKNHKILLKTFLQVRRISLGENRLNLLGKQCFLSG